LEGRLMRVRNASLLIGILSFIAAGGVWWYASQQFNQLVVTAQVVTVSEPVPAYTILTPALLTTREVPRAFVSEPIFVEPREALGRIAVTPLQPGMLLYRDFVVAPAEYRLVKEPWLEVISFPVDPASAVGGQVRVGHRVNVYRAVLAPGALTAAGEQRPSAAELLSADAAAVELLASAVQVVGVQTAQGQAVGDPAAPAAQSAGPQQRNSQPVQILTVAVEPEQARQIVRLVAEAGGQVRLWVSLAPLPAAIAIQD